MSSTELYIKDARVWVPHPTSVWEGARLLESYSTGAKVVLLITDSGERKEVPLKSESDLPHLRNPSILIGQNDLTALSYLHEPDVLYNLEVRFCERQAIYTYCGIVLVAINPYAELPLYGTDIIRAYRGHSMGELEPHIFAVAEEAYAKLEREKCDLSIIVSGESGAGKTVSAKYAMRYFAAVGGSESETQIERKVLASSPIMEAIGNAKTTRNDNSSRFGKFTKLLFTNEISVMSLTGGTMQTYLLEKSRVVFQAPGERNYHIFYQLCAAREKFPELKLDHQDSFRYLNQGQSPNIARVSDLAQFTETVDALKTLGFNKDDISHIRQVLAAILHLGNVTFTSKRKANSDEIDPDGCDINNNDPHLNVVSEILHLNIDNLRKWLTTRQIESMSESVLIPIKQDAAEAARDALAKHTYAKLFQYIVKIINKSLVSGREQNCFIGVLDIYGFETFEINSFEQFCINYANEKLQQQFNQHVFKLEQEVYLKEGIVWTMIDFYDNQPCIDLIESKLGVLDLLDEECRMPRGSDESWVGKLVEKCAKYKHFDKPRFGRMSFCVKHFSDTVEYSSVGFLEKNRDTVSKELVNVLRESKMRFTKYIMDLEEIDVGRNSVTSLGGRVVVQAAKGAVQQAVPQGRKRVTPSKQQRQTVGSQFRDSLSSLISTLHATTPHYVRCIKPNDDKAAFKWEAPKIDQQLRACGVLETVRISAAGFPSRYSYEDFYARYRLLGKKKQIVEMDLKASCRSIVGNWIKEEDKFRFGFTQIFFRAGQVAYLEQLRADIRRKHIIIVQSMVRRFIYHIRYTRLRATVLAIQTYSRGFLARQRTKALRQNRAAVIIQKWTRRWLCRRRFVSLRKMALAIQCRGRGMLARRRYKVALDNYKATEIQRFCRGYLARKRLDKKLRLIVKCQAAVRGFMGRRLFKKLRAEARTISHIQMRYKGLENKIFTLQQKMDDLSKANALLKTQNKEIPELKSKVEHMRALDNELKTLKTAMADKEDDLIKLMKQFDLERDEKMQLIDEREIEEKKWMQQKAVWRSENDELKKQVQEMIEMTKKDEIRVRNSQNRLLNEADNMEIHQAYQKTVKDKESLENDNYLLSEEVKRLQRLTGDTKGLDYATHSRSISNASQRSDFEDYGYESAKNTLEIKRTPPVDDTPENNEISTTPHRRNSQTVVILKLRKFLEDEKLKGGSYCRQIQRFKSKNNSSINTEDSLRVSELEVENEKLRQDYQLLRNSIVRGVEAQEMESQYTALEEESKRRRDECIQLRAVLAQQSQSLRSLGQTSMKVNEAISHVNGREDNIELVEAFQAQKLVNRQLESELTALTEEHNARLIEMSKHIDDMQAERTKLQDILQEKLSDVGVEDLEVLRRNDSYLRFELDKAALSYVELQAHINELSKKIVDLTKKNTILCNRLKEHGLNDSILLNEDVHSMAAVTKKKQQAFQGIFRYHPDDESKILQRLVSDMTPRVAITLLPGLPSYILFMSIRYTDLVNNDQHVKSLLSNFIMSVKKMCRQPNLPSDVRTLWLVNTIVLLNLLKQYGGLDEYAVTNTETQNQQLLKNFDLSEYRQVVHETIICLYSLLVQQIQEIIKPCIVSAILLHDEMARGPLSANRPRTLSLDLTSPDGGTDPGVLVNQLETFYKQFGFFGLSECYVEQILTQLMSFICLVSMNNLMLRKGLCMWKTGMRIRYNVSCLESWVRQKKVSNDILLPLAPLTQASSLLQLKKSVENVNDVFEICSDLTKGQVLKIIMLYTADDCEPPITPEFIEKLTKRLNERESAHLSSDKFAMEETLRPLKVVYSYSPIKLEEIELPSILKLDDVMEKI